MKKINYTLLVLVSLLVVFASCNRPMTYAERLRAEERVIAQFIAEKGFRILTTFPSDTIFGDNELFRDPTTGVYFGIICRGILFDANWEMFDENFNFFTEGQLDTIQFGRDFFVRFRGLNMFMSNDTILHSNDGSLDPVIMTYRGPVNRHTRHLYEGGIPGLVVPLSYIGYGGRVRLIVPFNMGNAWDRQQFQATFFDEVDYRFERGKPWRNRE